MQVKLDIHEVGIVKAQVDATIRQINRVDNILHYLCRSCNKKIHPNYETSSKSEGTFFCKNCNDYEPDPKYFLAFSCQVYDCSSTMNFHCTGAAGLTILGCSSYEDLKTEINALNNDEAKLLDYFFPRMNRTY